MTHILETVLICLDTFASKVDFDETIVANSIGNQFLKLELSDVPKFAEYKKQICELDKKLSNDSFKKFTDAEYQKIGSIFDAFKEL
jgi:hypothetical protein